MALAVNGPMHVRVLARTIGSNSSEVFSMVERLREAGLVVKRDVPGYRKVVALNKQLKWSYYLLRDLLFAIDRCGAIWLVDGAPTTMLQCTAP